MTDSLAWFEAKVDAVAAIAFAEMMRDPSQRQYVWFKRGDLVTSPQQPPGMTIADPRPVPSDRTREAVRAWVYDRCKCVECLPIETGVPWDAS